MIVFREKDHLYYTKGNPEDKWDSVTRFVSKFKNPFDKEEIALKCSKNKKSKWYKMAPEEIIRIWDEESKRATREGTAYHLKKEQEYLSKSAVSIDGHSLPVFKPIIENGLKVAPEQKLSPGIYPEHFVYLKSAKLCGQVDRLEIVDGKVNIIDFKTNKSIDKESYKDWKGSSKKMLYPLDHLDDCNYNHYNLQLSIYMYIILKHNRKLKPGKLIIEHIIFKKEGENEYGYPIYQKDENGIPIVDKIERYEMPYLKNEVNALLNYKELEEYDS